MKIYIIIFFIILVTGCFTQESDFKNSNLSNLCSGVVEKHKDVQNYNMAINKSNALNITFYSIANIDETSEMHINVAKKIQDYIKNDQLEEIIKQHKNKIRFIQIRVIYKTSDSIITHSYDSYYYTVGTTIYSDDKHNEINNFKNWYYYSRIRANE